MELSTIINWTSPFPSYWLLGDIFHFYPNFNSIFISSVRVFAEKCTVILFYCSNGRHYGYIVAPITTFYCDLYNSMFIFFAKIDSST